MTDDIVKKMLALLLALAVAAAALSGCDTPDTDWQSADELRTQLYHQQLDADKERNVRKSGDTDMVMPCAADDVFNPYYCTSTLTRSICSLMYDSLLQMTPDYEPEYIIAKSVEVDHTLVTVHVRSGIVFSNGAKLTADDVSYSFYLATQKGSLYRENLKNVVSCSQEGMKVTFVMQNEHVNAYRVLDFPIVHFDPSANQDLPPIGSGRFCFAMQEDGVTPNQRLLVRNTKWYNPDPIGIETIALKVLPTVESIVHSIEIGTVSYLYSDMRDGTPKNVSANYRKVDLNNLIYLGVNTNDTALADENVRRAVAAAISTNEVAAAGFGGMAVGATGPFTPNWKAAAAYQTGSGRSSVKTAQEYLDQSGYVFYRDGVREDQSGRQLSFNLLLSRRNSRHRAAAENLKSQLAQVGIRLELTEISPEGLIKRAEEGKYHFYMAEYAVLNDMDIGRLFTPGEGLYNGPRPYDSVQTYTNYRLGLGSLEDFIEAFENELPFIPLCYRLGMVIYARTLEGVGNVSEDQPFYRMEDWIVTASHTESQ